MKRAAFLIGSVAAVLAGCEDRGSENPDASIDAGPDAGVEPSDAGVDAADASLACVTHHDCSQGDYCHRGVCRFEEGQPVYHCGRPGCPPGRWCVEAGGRRSLCADDDAYRCENACDCGPGFCCVGERCVRDAGDPLLGDPASPATCPVGPDVPFEERVPTYCATDATCHAGARTWEASDRRGTFLAFDPRTAQTTSVCGGRSCFGTACACDPGESCVETIEPDAPVGAVCGRLSGGTCVSHALAEAVFSWAPAELLECCRDGCAPGEPCDAGWMTNGNRYGFERVVATCAPAGSCTCGDGECCPDELSTCLADCVPSPATCGDGRCDPFERYQRCPGDCPPGCGDGRCASDESPASCATDCAQACGDGWCSPAEATARSCAADCEGRCADGVSYNRAYRVCGDGECAQSSACDLDEPESCATCEADCGRCEWEVVHSAPQSVSLAGIASVISRQWVIGPGAELLGVTPMVERRGRDYVLVDLRDAIRDVEAFWGDDTVVFAVGGTVGAPAALIREGGAWTEMSVPGTATGSQRLRSVWGSERANVWAATYDHIYRFDGSSWTVVTSGRLQLVEEVWTSGASDVYVVGTHCTSGCVAGEPWGAVVRYDGSSWTEVATADAWLRAVWGSGPDDVFVVGDGGTILHFDGSAWRAMPSGSGASLVGVWGSGPDDVYAVGDGALLHYDGGGWSPVDVGVPIPSGRGGAVVRGHVHGSGPDNVLVLVHDGTDHGVILRRFDGTSWSDALTDSPHADLIDAAARGPESIYVIGMTYRRAFTQSRGGLGRFDGRRIHWIEPRAVDDDLVVVDVAPGGRVYAAGAGRGADFRDVEGRVASYADGSWTLEVTTTNAAIDIVSVADDELYLAVEGDDPTNRDAAGPTQYFDGTRWAPVPDGRLAPGLTHASAFTINTAGDLIVAGNDGVSLMPIVVYARDGVGEVLGAAAAVRRFTSLWGAGRAEVLGYGVCDDCRELGGYGFERVADGGSTLLETFRGDPFALDGLAADDAVRVGFRSFIEVYDGSTWRRPALDLRQPGTYECPNLNRVLPIDATYYVFGANELVLRRVPRGP